MLPVVCGPPAERDKVNKALKMLDESADMVLHADQTMGEWYAARKNHFFAETRSLGPLHMFEFFQPPGFYEKPGMDIFLLQLALRCDERCVLDMGDSVFVAHDPLPGSMVMSLPGSRTTYDLPCETHGIALELDAKTMRNLALEIDPNFDGGFGEIHSKMWRDHALRDGVLRLWRAAKGDEMAPIVDTDSAIMTFAAQFVANTHRGDGGSERILSLAPHVLRRVLDYIDDNLDGDCGLFRLAAVAELSPFHFARGFRHDMADPPHRYVVARRLQRAAELVRLTRMDLSEIALACGFSHQSRMTHAFTRHLGISPGRMRRTANEGRPPLYIVAPPTTSHG